jgi:hypothetical protein
MAKYEVVGVILAPVQSASQGGCAGMIALLVGLGLTWACAGVGFMKVGIIIPGFDIEDHEVDGDWVPPWLDLWPDSRHGLFISSEERACYAPGYDFSACPAELRADAEAARTAAADTRERATTSTGCNLRPSPNTSNTPIRELAAGQECSVNERKGSWVSVECDDTEGWVSSSCL